MNNPGSLKVVTRGTRETVITRDFQAPRRLVFDALTKPALLRHWYGPRGWSLAVCDIDLKVGGEWHFVVRRANGTEIGMRGIYREVVPPKRFVHTTPATFFTFLRCDTAWSMAIALARLLAEAPARSRALGLTISLKGTGATSTEGRRRVTELPRVYAPAKPLRSYALSVLRVITCKVLMANERT